METPSDLKTLKPSRSIRGVLSVFSFGAVHSKRRRPSLGRAARSTILFGTIDSHGTGGAFLPQAKARSRMNQNRMIVLVFIVSTIRLSLGLQVLLAERFAARSKGPLCLRTA